jgi:N12 class adenine-specific DNA methylase
MPGGEHRPGRFTQLDFDSLATVADDIQVEHGSEVRRPDIQAFSGTRHAFVLKPGAIQYTLDAALSAPSTLEEAGAADQDRPGQDAPQQFSGRRYSLIPGGVQYTLDALFGRIVQDEEAATSPPAERPHLDGHSKPALPQTLFDTLADLPPDDLSGNGTGEHAERGAGRGGLEPSRPSRDFRITDAHQIGAGGLHEKARANLAAILLLKSIETDHRDSSDAEKAILVRYAGWGALAQVFEEERRLKHEWQAAATELKKLLTEEEYASARATTPNAHFTSPLVIRAIWQGLSRLGVTGSVDVLEPAVGAGHFFGLMPDTLQGGHRTGVELDGLTARIAQALYPDAKIFPQGFETTNFPDNFFDLVVGNVPYGDYPVHDPAMKRSLTRAIHDYFFAKSLDNVREGGIMALITSRYTMDKQNDVIRTYLAERADLVGAIRLPNTAFKGNAGTEVTTDILFLQKRAKGTEAQGERWTDTEVILLDETPVTLNEYYVRYPRMMLGRLALTGTMYKGREPTLAGELTEEVLARAIAALPEGLYAPRVKGHTVPKVEIGAGLEDRNGVKDGGFASIDGRVVVRQGNRFEPASCTMMDTLRIRGMLAIRDAVRAVFATQLQDAPDAEITRARERLNSLYERFVQGFGYLSAAENVRAFAGDPDRPLLLSLEIYDSDTKIATKAPVFERRTLERYVPVEQVDSSAAALAVSLNETGGIAWERMAGLTGLSIAAIQAELAGQVYQNPEGQCWETADEYLSGDVRTKLQAAIAAAAVDPVYQTNVEALRAVQPEDILPGDIHARLGAGWIPAGDIKGFIAQLLKVPEGDVAVLHAGEIATWTVTLDYTARHAVSNTTTYGTTRLCASSLIEQALNVRVPTVYDTLDDANKTRVINQAETIAAREAQQKLKDLFASWLWEDPQRAERLARLYNDTFNTIRLRTYDGSHLTLPGMNRSELRRGDLDPHQKSAVWRILQSKNTLIGHVVGAGKTNVLTAACMELKRLGLAKKPMIVVPNHLVEQWGAAFLTLYPQADIFVAGKEHFQSGKREQAMARIATGNFDAVIISHKSFESLPVADETFKRFLSKEIATLADAIQEVSSEQGDSRSIVKQLEKAKKRLEEKIQARAAREQKDDGVTFEQLGIDRVFVDEADLYKNLGFATKMSRIAGLPNSDSNRAMDMYMKTRYVSERDGGVVFATGTPVSNTMAELYTMQRYLAPERLEAAGVSHFDAWAANFGEAVTALELAPDGSGYRMHTRFAKFVNLPELLTMFHSFADIQTADMLKLPKPELAGGKPEVIVSPASPALKDYVSGLVDRAQRIRSGGVDPRVDNMLAITNDGRKAALDMRLVDYMSEPDEEAKVSKAAQNIHRIWADGHEQRLTQAVFCDLSTPNADRFNVYDELRSKLLDVGIPEKDIAYIHHADTDQKKQALFENVNAGRVRILLGSTEKMGAGTNIQQRLVALHHLDAPWRPRDIEQRDGRILRQGNSNPVVSIFRYVTEGSFDAYLYQTLETKARFIAQVMSGTVTVREAEDISGGALNYAEIKAIASGNPLVMEKIRIDTEVRKLDVLRAAHRNQQFDIGKQVRALPEQIARAKHYQSGLLEDIKRRNTHNSQDFTIQIGQQTYTGKQSREAAAEALLKGLAAGGEEFRICGAYKGFQLVVRGGETNTCYLRGSHAYELYIHPQNPLGMLAGLETELRRLDRYAEAAQAEYERKEKALVDYTEQLGRPFEQEERLRELLVQQADINRSLDLDKSDTQIVDEERAA